MKPQISFIIRSYNEQKFLPSKLTNLVKRLKESKARSEIIMGIQGNDKSLEIAKGFKKEFKELQIYKMPKPDFIGTTNFLIKKAKSDIIVVDDADNLFVGDVDRVVKLFENKKVCAIIQEDRATQEWFNEGHRIFDQAYFDVKLKHHSKILNSKLVCVTDPIFSVHIFRKSALKDPYIQTYDDDHEITKKLLDKGDLVIYDKQLIFSIMNNSLQEKFTISKIFKRRRRTEDNRKNATAALNTDRFSIGNRIGEFTEAVFLTFTRVSILEFFEFVEYLIVIIAATIVAKVGLLIKNGEGYVQAR